MHVRSNLLCRRIDHLRFRDPFLLTEPSTVLRRVERRNIDHGAVIGCRIFLGTTVIGAEAKKYSIVTSIVAIAYERSITTGVRRSLGRSRPDSSLGAARQDSRAVRPRVGRWRSTEVRCLQSAVQTYIKFINSALGSAFGQEDVMRSSLMPPGLSETMSLGELKDVIEFLNSRSESG